MATGDDATDEWSDTNDDEAPLIKLPPGMEPTGAQNAVVFLILLSLTLLFEGDD